MRKLYLLTALLAFGIALSAQRDFQFTNDVYDPDIHSVRFGPVGYQYFFPLLELGGSQQLLLSFDDFDPEVKNYTYRIFHCDMDWQPSDLSPLEYLDGFEEDDIRQYHFSFNTIQQYTYFELLFPNRSMDVTKSGNYVLVVYEDEREKKAVITRRFVVVDRQVGVQATVTRPAQVSKLQTHQEIDFIVDYERFPVRSPMQELRATVLQNGRWDNAITNLTAKFQRVNTLVFDYQDRIVFPGGNEFRGLDLRSLKAPVSDIVHVEVGDKKLEVDLAVDPQRGGRPHLSYQDLNGQFIIENYDQRSEPTQSSDYPYVLFSLGVNEPYYDQDVYLLGAFTDWKLKPEYKMTYNPAVPGYVARLPIKQGFYNYFYALTPSQPRKGQPVNVEIILTEGSHADTENDYYILVYYRPFGGRYDQLVGAYQLNSLGTR